MRFLVISKNKFQVPPEIAPGLFEAMIAWNKKLKENGKIESVWGDAAGFGGGAIVNVNSNEELNEILIEYPLAPFSKTKVIPIVDLDDSMRRLIQQVEAMAQAPGGRR